MVAIFRVPRTPPSCATARISKYDWSHAYSPKPSRLPRRPAALLYDALLLAALWWLITLVAVAVAGGNEVRAPHNRWLTVALFVSAYLYYVWPWVRGGQPLGMTWHDHLTGTRLVHLIGPSADSPAKQHA